MITQRIDFTLITTSFNDSKFIQEYVTQIESQTVKPIELIIVDGGSKDNTIQVIKQIAADVKSFKIRLISDVGRLNIATALNIGIKSCETEFMIIGVIGNRYDGNFFESLIDYQIGENFDVVYGPIYGINKTSFARVFNIAFINSNRGWDFGIASNRGVLIRNKVFEKCGLFQENFIYAGEDTEFYRRILLYDVKVGYCKEAKLFWQTPTTWEEYVKKMKANSIADLQFEPKSFLLKNVISRFLIILISLVMTFLLYPFGFLLPLSLLFLFIILSAIRIKSFYIPSLFLRTHFFFLPSYYYLLNRKVYCQKRIK